MSKAKKIKVLLNRNYFFGFLFSILIISSSCSSSFEIIESYSQKYSAGIPNGISGKNYVIILKSRKNHSNIKIDKLYTDNILFNVNNSFFKGEKINSLISRKDTIIVYTNGIKTNDSSNVYLPTIKENNFSKNQGVLFYYEEGILKRLLIKNFIVSNAIIAE